VTGVPAMPATSGKPMPAAEPPEPPAALTQQAPRLPSAAALPAAPPATGDCRPELRALNLCSTGNPKP